MRVIRLILTALFCSLLITACGNSGALYLPDESADAEAKENRDSLQSEDEDEEL